MDAVVPRTQEGAFEVCAEWFGAIDGVAGRRSREVRQDLLPSQMLPARGLERRCWDWECDASCRPLTYFAIRVCARADHRRREARHSALNQCPSRLCKFLFEALGRILRRAKVHAEAAIEL